VSGASGAPASGGAAVSSSGSATPTHAGSAGASLSKLTLATVLAHAPAGLVADFSRRDNFFSVPLSGTLLQVISYFALGLHRVCVLTPDTKREFVGVVSQSDAIRYVHKNLDKLPFVADKTLAELGLIPSRPLTVSQNATVLDALILMQEHAVSSLALTDSAGALVANLSMTDIAFVFAAGQLSILHHPCRDLVREVRRRRDEESHFETKVPVFHCTANTPLRKVIGSLVATRTHRIWVTAAPSLEPSVPVAVVTLTDVLRLLSPKNLVKLPSAVPKNIKPVAFVPAV
jgi:CBS domain-containing protein